MGDQWAGGYADRIDRLPERYETRAPEQLIVVNASSGAEWTKTSMLGLPVIGEIKAVLRDKDILYDNTTSHRRTALIDRFDYAEDSGVGMTGTYVGINQSPYRIASIFVDHPTRGARAQAVIDMLDQAPTTEAEWKEITKASDTMSTNLSRIDAGAAADLVWHAYVVTMCNLHVILDYPIGGGIPARDRFRT